MEKVKFELEIPIHASPNMLYQYISSPSNLQEWFADKVNSRGKIFSFVWEDTEELAELIIKKAGERIRWKWLESEGDESFFEIKIEVDALTKDVSLIVTDFVFLKNKAMINFNSELYTKENIQLTTDNRGFKYGDGIFETIKVVHKKVIFWEDHYFRLMASMRMLRMKIPMEFTLEFLEQEILKTVDSIEKAGNFRVRLNVFRKDGGLYTPKTNAINYLIEASEISTQSKTTYEIDVFKDFYNYSGLLSTIKTNNRMLNTLASIYADENDLDNCVLLNERKGVVEVANGNIFIVKDTVVKTPALTEGCIKGIVRNKVIEILTKNKDFTIEETAISPFEIQKADEVFITNAIAGIQVVTKYKKKSFTTVLGNKLHANLKVLQIAGI